MQKIADLNVVSETLLPTPREIKEQLLLNEKAVATVLKGRSCIEAVLDDRDPRLFLVAGPCSIHDLDAAEEYMEKLHGLALEVEHVFVVLMRVYFSKPRTTVGWKGFINDPRLDDSFAIAEGLFKARRFLRLLADIGLPCGTEALDSITPQYIDDLISWSAIGARTSESQTHREMASGLSTPVGFKNGTDGNIQAAINALKTASKPHHFLGINKEGQCAVLETKGNKYGHLVLRGGQRPNYDSVSIAVCEQELRRAGLREKLMIDCSHGNSLKNPDLQPLVLQNCVNQILEGNQSIAALMLESNLFGGNQELTDDRSKLKYGVSITDACMDWETTRELVLKAAAKLEKALPGRAGLSNPLKSAENGKGTL